MAQSTLDIFDAEMREKHGIIIGTDEAGRGPLAGPVVAAAVLLDVANTIEGLGDSKKLSEKKRELLFPLIMKNAKAVGIALASPQEIDKINILQASLLSMYRSIEKVDEPWNLVLIDGNKTIPQLSLEKQLTVVKGDGKSASIAAASIVAKVVRDKIMKGYDKIWPQYDLKSNKGYPTAKHREEVKKKGITKIHRVTFCETLMSQTEMLF